MENIDHELINSGQGSDAGATNTSNINMATIMLRCKENNNVITRYWCENIIGIKHFENNCTREELKVLKPCCSNWQVTMEKRELIFQKHIIVLHTSAGVTFCVQG